MKKIFLLLILIVSYCALYSQSFDSLAKVNQFIGDSIKRRPEKLNAASISKILTGIVKFVPVIADDTSMVTPLADGRVVFQRKDSTAYVYDVKILSFRKYIPGSGVIDNSKVPLGRTLTINSVTYSLDVNRAWTIPTGTDSADNAGYGITKTATGTLRSYKADTAILFPAVRATIPVATDSAANAGYGITKSTSGTNRSFKADTATLFPAVRGTIAPFDSSTLNLNSRLATKQPTLVSTVNIKSINGVDITGPGNVVVTASGADSASNADYGIIKTTSGTTRTYKLDTATVFPAIRATIPAVGPDSALSAGYGIIRSIAGLNRNIKVDTATVFAALRATIPVGISNLTRTNGYGITATVANPTTAPNITIATDTGTIFPAVRATVTKATVGLPLADNTPDVSKPVSTAQAAAIATKLPNTAFVNVNGTNYNLSTNPSIITGPQNWYPATEPITDTFTINYANGSLQVLPFSRNHSLVITNIPNGRSMTLAFVSTVSQTSYFNLPNGPWNPDFAGELGGVSVYTVVYDSVNARFNWTVSVGGYVVTTTSGGTRIIANGAHDMGAFIVPNINGYFRKEINYAKVNYKQNWDWFFGDIFDGTYAARMQLKMDSCYAEGVQVMAGINGAAAARSQILAMALAAFAHPSCYKINGKPVFHQYLGTQASVANLRTDLAANGYPVGTYIMAGNPFYSWFGVVTPGVWTDNYATRPQDSNSIKRAYTFSGFDMIIPFLVDKGPTDLAQLNNGIFEDTCNVRIAFQMGKYSGIGLSVLYYNPGTQKVEIGYDGLDLTWRAILGLPSAWLDSLKVVALATKNDYFERSYVTGPPTIDSANGQWWVPTRSSGGTYGSPINSNPALDHSGPLWFSLPYLEALVNRQTAPTFTAPEIYSWNPIHLREVGLGPSTVPSFYTSAGAQYNQAWYDNTYNRSIPSWVADGTKYPRFNTFRMAAFLPVGGRIGINGVIDATVYPPNSVAFLSAPLVTGITPTYQIANAAGTVLYNVSGKHAIQTTAAGGEYEYMISKLL